MRFAEASLAYYLLADTSCPNEQLERAGKAMDAAASKLRGL